MKRLFWQGLAQNMLSVELILTDPHSYAALDAEQYKMFPREQVTASDRIIINNLNKLIEFKRQNKKANLKIYLTQVALPYGVMKTRHKHSENNHMKVDIYAAKPGTDDNRPSFYMLEKNPETEGLYRFISLNIEIIKSTSVDFSDGHPDMSWLEGKHIIHKGVINKNVKPHTYGAFVECISKNYPIEVDLLKLNDGTVIVGRVDEKIEEYGFDKPLSDLNISEFNKLNRKIVAKEGKESRKLTLTQFCDLVGDRIPVLFEIKLDNNSSEQEAAEYVKDIVAILRDRFRRSYIIAGDYNYKRSIQRFAIHSANPYAIKAVKELDCTIPCGIITCDFSTRGASDKYVKLHKEHEYMNICHPDFINCDVNYLSGTISRLCQENNIPLFSWTIKNAEDQEIAENDYNCDKIVIEGATSFNSLG